MVNLEQVTKENNNDRMDCLAYHLRGSKKMKVEEMEEEGFEMDLIVKIHDAEGLEDRVWYPSIYQVVFWVHPGNAFQTQRVMVGHVNPVWDSMYLLMVDKPADCRFLYVEVIRFGHPFQNEPGTSTGSVVVGRARIPLPEFSRRTAARYDLIRPDAAGFKPEGRIGVSLGWRNV